MMEEYTKKVTFCGQLCRSVGMFLVFALLVPIGIFLYILFVMPIIYLAAIFCSEPKLGVAEDYPMLTGFFAVLFLPIVILFALIVATLATAAYIIIAPIAFIKSKIDQYFVAMANRERARQRILDIVENNRRIIINDDE